MFQQYKYTKLLLKLNQLKQYIVLSRLKHDWRYCPTTKEVEKLYGDFPKPRQTVNELLSPLVSVDPLKYQPTLTTCMMLQPDCWKCVLELKWPYPFKVISMAKSKLNAEEYSYLQTCDLLKELGLLDSKGQIPDYKKQLLSFHDYVSIQLNDFKKTTMRLDSTREICCHNRFVWTCRLSMSWPIEVTTESQGLSQMAAENNAAALVFIKFKANGILGRNSSLSQPAHMSLPYKPMPNLKASHKLYVDASQMGYGAYLVHSETNEHKENSVPWFMSHWNSSIHDWQNDAESNFFEFFAMLSAVYTWKKKLKNQTVVVYCDNSSVVGYVQNGLKLKEHKHFRLKKMFEVLCYTCYQYNITISAKHISRWENLAADFLSKHEMDKFRMHVPSAKTVMKKPKKLEFFTPLVPTNPLDIHISPHDSYLNTRQRTAS